uniref:Uncharacterized protein n=1 Tax=Nelumbo nucifera TaxID=4432 RepID=A0A822XK77_NELNU|nr:TPA_asm: hypothetical protein HUJ06_021004 [Nelumbo nucifera]
MINLGLNYGFLLRRLASPIRVACPLFHFRKTKKWITAPTFVSFSFDWAECASRWALTHVIWASCNSSGFRSIHPWLRRRYHSTYFEIDKSGEVGNGASEGVVLQADGQRLQRIKDVISEPLASDIDCCYYLKTEK